MALNNVAVDLVFNNTKVTFYLIPTDSTMNF